MAFSKQHMAALFQQVCRTKNVTAMASLLEADPLQLLKLRLDKPYYTFYVNKQKGKQRLIEAPHTELKLVLRKLNNYLQSTYFFCRSTAAYGFVQQPRNANKKRNILTNARLHCGKKYLLNIDLKDFFHQVTRIRVLSIFKSPPFNFNIEFGDFLSELCTYQGRLPMGSPVSPVLSNFATRELDADLLFFAHENDITYSRYVDDLSFSSNLSLTADHFHQIQHLITGKGFSMNPEKIQWMGEGDEKTVTGLILKERPEVSDAFLSELESNLERYKHVLEFSAVGKGRNSVEWIGQFKEYLQGKLNFLNMVYGFQHPLVLKMNGLYQDAYNTRPFIESFNWNDFPYS